MQPCSRGKSIGISFPGDTPHLVLKRYLRNKGLDPDRSVTYVAGQISPIGFQGLSAGTLDAAVMAPPFSVIAQDTGFHGLASLGKEVPDAPTINGLVASDKKIRSQPNQVAAMVRAMLRSVRQYRQKPEAAMALLSARFNLEPAMAKRVYRDSLDTIIDSGEVGADKVRDVLSLARESGQRHPAAPKPETLLDMSFLREAQRAYTTGKPARTESSERKRKLTALGTEIINQLQKLHDDSRSDAPNVPAVDIEMVTRMAARREIIFDGKVGRLQQRRDRHRTDRGRLRRIQDELARSGNHADKRRHQKTITRLGLIQLAEDAHVAGMKADFLVALAQRRFLGAKIAGLDPPAGKRYLAAVVPHALGTLG